MTAAQPWSDDASRGDRRERLALASARIPFRLKVAVGLGRRSSPCSACFFWLSQFDTDWMLDNLAFIAGGLQYTHRDRRRRHRAGGRAGRLGALGRLSSQPDRLRRLGLLRLVLPRHAADRADVPDLPGAAAGRAATSSTAYPALPRRRRQLADRSTRQSAGIARARPQLRRLHDRDLPRRHPVGRRRAGRGGRRARHDVPAEDAQGRAAAGVPGHHPADRQRVHRDDEGHRAGVVPRRDRGQRRDLPAGAARRQGGLQEPGGLRRRGRPLLGADRRVHVLPAPAGEAGVAAATSALPGRRSGARARRGMG